ncbi:hypothetical protein G5V59_16345 [Nocardioides sp. W3-2-3]|uniref:hypothetical protein n=1 Tax=Nocardioides convexus TaxID=2712224 RepID=UPI00241820A7|nr:hypothetical protein [Nocardioides convexus]NHA00947.1 hypothetical protein [Nocardioides convexus]
MTWNETHRRWHALRAIEEQTRGLGVRGACRGTTTTPWCSAAGPGWSRRCATAGGSPSTRRLDTHLTEGALEEQRRVLERRARGVLRVLEAEDARAAA